MESCTIEVKAVPNAPRNEVVGWFGDALKIKVHAPALEGKANQELCGFLAKRLGLPNHAVSLVRGETSRRKIVEITSLTKEEVVRLLFTP